MEFTLTITLGNEGMKSAQDVADALHAVSEYLPSGDSIYPDPHAPIDEYIYRESSGALRDANGNTVGHWEFTGE